MIFDQFMLETLIQTAFIGKQKHWMRACCEASIIEDINEIPVVGFQAYPRDSISGRLNVVKLDNEVRIKTDGVGKFFPSYFSRPF